MKKLVFILIIAATGLFIACEGNTQTEDVGVGASKGVEAMEALAGAENDSTLACTCEHGCKTKEDCVAKCGEGCGMLKQ
ncbi:MAG: hypothetical protein K0S33_3912 [Bacteroidetes bacterium]|jgi:hypothetical protein|nr:hypothetical protein [Bacteroidota bacterium]